MSNSGKSCCPRVHFCEDPGTISRFKATPERPAGAECCEVLKWLQEHVLACATPAAHGGGLAVALLLRADVDESAEKGRTGSRG